MNKSKIKVLISKFPILYRGIRYIYSFLFHRKRLLSKCSYGDMNPNKKILVIRPNSEDGIQGLMSLFIQAARWMNYAKDNGYNVYVDYKTYKTQYYDAKNNAWEFFFLQPDGLRYEDVYNSKNVLLSGVSIKKTIEDSLFRESVFKDRHMLLKCNRILQFFSFTDEVCKIIDDEARNLCIEDCIGVYIRGTDYARLKPTGEFRQPNINDVCDKIVEFSEKYEMKKVFLVTEDYEYYSILKNKFGNLLYTVSYDTFIEGYNGKDFLSKTNLLAKNPRKRGIDYLVKIILLSKCRYLISSITMGSIAAYCFNGGKYVDEYIFDLGYYE